MKSPAVALASLFLACLLPAQAEDSRNLPLPAGNTAYTVTAGPPLLAGTARDFEADTPPGPDTIAAPDETGHAMAHDVHPFGNSFFLGGGAYYGGRQAGFGTPAQRNVRVGDVAFPPTDYSRPESRTQYNTVVPFVGGGIDTRFSEDSPWGFRLLAGAAFFGPAEDGPHTPDKALSDSTGPSQELQARDVAPLVQLGLSYRF